MTVAKDVLYPLVVQEWLNSPEGKKAIEEALAKSELARQELEKARRISPELLRIPVTI